jgi:hypothetical protein
LLQPYVSGNPREEVAYGALGVRIQEFHYGHFGRNAEIRQFSINSGPATIESVPPVPERTGDGTSAEYSGTTRRISVARRNHLLNCVALQSFTKLFRQMFRKRRPHRYTNSTLSAVGL